jgi:hypothetical protein
MSLLVFFVAGVAALSGSVTWAASSRAETPSAAMPTASAEPASLLHLVNPPQRIIDTRETLIFGNLNIPSYNACEPTAAGVDYDIVPENSYFCLGVGSSVPPSATAVLLNVTATDSQGPGYIQLVTGTAVPGATSHLNKASGQTVANQVTLALSSAHYMMVVNQGAATHIVIDLEGYYTASA